MTARKPNHNPTEDKDEPSKLKQVNATPHKLRKASKCGETIDCSVAAG